MKESIQEQKLQQKILEGTIEAFNQKGLKFTMDDLAGILGMSKKTIYTVFSDKTSLFLSMVDYLFDTIKESERAILENEALSTVEKSGQFSVSCRTAIKTLILRSCICSRKNILKYTQG